MFKIISDVDFVCKISPNGVGWIDEERVSSEDGLMVNREYIDLRGLEIDYLDAAFEFEEEAYRRLEECDFAEDVVLEIDDEWFEEPILPDIDFGMGSIVAALSVIGCAPITSCRGQCIAGWHRHEAPMVCFYAPTEAINPIVSAAHQAKVSLAPNEDMIEAFCDDLRKMHRFADLLRIEIKGPR